MESHSILNPYPFGTVSSSPYFENDSFLLSKGHKQTLYANKVFGVDKINNLVLEVAISENGVISGHLV